MDTARRVYHQMLPDFPGQAIAWVLENKWIGPTEVPLGAIDTSNRANWTASHEPDKVKWHVQKIREGVSPPIILGQFPEHDKLFIIDAHHRFLAYEVLKRNPLAYVGMIAAKDVEKAMATHAQQYSGRSRIDVSPALKTTAPPVANRGSASHSPREKYARAIVARLEELRPRRKVNAP